MSRLGKIILSFHKERLAGRNIRLMSSKRGEITQNKINRYLDNLKKSLENVSDFNILNYHETSMTDYPGRQRCTFKRGSKIWGRGTEPLKKLGFRHVCWNGIWTTFTSIHSLQIRSFMGHLVRR